jgi:hypothetical protein
MGPCIANLNVARKVALLAKHANVYHPKPSGAQKSARFARINICATCRVASRVSITFYFNFFVFHVFLNSKLFRRFNQNLELKLRANSAHLRRHAPVISVVDAV